MMNNVSHFENRILIDSIYHKDNILKWKHKRYTLKNQLLFSLITLINDNLLTNNNKISSYLQFKKQYQMI